MNLARPLDLSLSRQDRKGNAKEERPSGCLNGFDGLVFPGTLRLIACPFGLQGYGFG
jgi:hypothetical protein